MAEKIRLQFDINEEDFARFERLRKRSGAKSNAALVAKALAMYEWIIEQRQAGRTMHIECDGREMDVEAFGKA